MRDRLLLAGLCLALGPTLAVAAPGGIPADAGRLHVYVHYDYMVEADGTSYAPDVEAIDRVREAFDVQGIELHIDPHHTAIPAHEMIVFGFGNIGSCPETADAVSFDDLKRQYYRPTSNHPWKYAIFGVRTDCYGTSGKAWINGDDFVISLGQYDWYRELPRERVLQFFAGTFMHELGHNLGLHHGGVEPTNYKPNYLSVMNYSFQSGIPYAATLGSETPVGRRLDFSRQALATLDEADLDETVGINAGTTDITVFFRPDQGSVGVGPATGPIDWNGNGDASERHVASNLAELEFPEQLAGFDDWSYVRGVLRGTIERGPRRLESHDRAHRPEVLAIDPASGTSLGGTEVRIYGKHLGHVDHVAFGSTPAASFRVENDRTLVAVAPPGTGTVHVNVSSEGNPSPTTAADLYGYLRPVVHEVLPASGLLGSGTTITVKGERLANTTHVTFSLGYYAVDPWGYTVVDDNTIEVQTPGSCYVFLSGCDADLVGRILVFTSDYGQNELGTDFRDPAAWAGFYAFLTSPRPSPVITSITPSTGPAGTNVTITGSGFRYFFGNNGCCEQNAGLVVFGDTPATNVAIWSEDRITADVPPGEGTVDVRVFTLIGKSPPAPEARYTYPAP